MQWAKIQTETQFMQKRSALLSSRKTWMGTIVSQRLLSAKGARAVQCKANILVGRKGEHVCRDVLRGEVHWDLAYKSYKDFFLGSTRLPMSFLKYLTKAVRQRPVYWQSYNGQHANGTENFRRCLFYPTGSREGSSCSVTLSPIPT